MFHHFHGDRHPKGQGAISADEFGAMLDKLGADRILPAKDWMEKALAGRLGESDLCLTFDDALLCQYEVALPAMRARGLTAFWFVYSSVFEGGLENLEIFRHFRTTRFRDIGAFYEVFFAAATAAYPQETRDALARFDPATYLAAFPFYSTEDRIFRFLRDDVLGPARYAGVVGELMRKMDYDPRRNAADLWMSDAHLRTLSDEGHVIGLHSYTHPTRLAELGVAEQRHEYRRNFDHLTRVLGAPPTTMSHPCNSYGPETLDILREFGVRLGFRANMQPVANRSMFEFAREDHANLMKEFAA